MTSRASCSSFRRGIDGGLLMAIAFVVLCPWRLPVAIIAAVYAGLLSLDRLAFGGHFISDVVISWGLTLLVIAIILQIYLAVPLPGFAPARLEAGRDETGREASRAQGVEQDMRRGSGLAWPRCLRHRRHRLGMLNEL